MRRPRASRFVAALAALLFFGGETAVPGLDALIFHSGGAPAVFVAHVESSSTTNHHADQCMLSFRLANGRVSATLPVAIRFQGMALRPAAAAPAVEPHRGYAGLHQQSRAPPAPLA